MESCTVGTTVLHEPSSAFDPDREMKDRKLTQIFKKLHMEQDLNSFSDFDDTVPRPSKVALNHLDELSKGKAERCRPRKILDYAVLAKGKSYRNDLVRSFANRCLETDGASKSGAGSRRIRFQKGRSENGISALSIKRRSRCGRYTSASKKSNKLRSISLPVTASVARKKKNSKSQGFTSGTKGGILKRRVKDANNIKQAFLISKKLLNSQNQHFEEFILPEKWIKESQKRKKVIKAKSGGEVSSSSASVEDLAMERLVRAFKTAKLLYPEKFAEYFPDFIHSFEPGNNKEKRVKQNGVKSKRMYPKTIKNEEDALIFDKNIAPDSGEEQSKRIRKVSKFLREYSTDSGITKKKLTGSSKISRSNGPSAGTSGLRKRSKKSDSPSDRSILSKSQQSGRVIGDSGEIIGVLTSKRRRCAKSALRSNVSAKVTDVNVPVIQNNIEDSATESSSDESGNVRSSKRHRAQSGFYKTMVTLYDKKRS